MNASEYYAANTFASIAPVPDIRLQIANVNYYVKFVKRGITPPFDRLGEQLMTTTSAGKSSGGCEGPRCEASGAFAHWCGYFLHFSGTPQPSASSPFSK